MKKKVIVPVLFTLILLLVVIMVRGAINNRSTSPLPSPSQSINKNTVIFYSIVLKETDKEKYYPVTIEGKTTALDLLKQKTKVITQGEDQMAFVVEIDGIKADSKKQEYWAFYVNDKLARVGAGSYILKNNDHILWKIAKY